MSTKTLDELELENTRLARELDCKRNRLGQALEHVRRLYEELNQANLEIERLSAISKNIRESGP